MNDWLSDKMHEFREVPADTRVYPANPLLDEQLGVTVRALMRWPNPHLPLGPAGQAWVYAEVARMPVRPIVPLPAPRNWYAEYVARWRMSPVNFGWRFGSGVEPPIMAHLRAETERLWREGKVRII